MGASARIVTKDATWKGLYRIGGVAVLIAVIVFRRNLGEELMAFRGFGVIAVPETTPSSAYDWFTLLQNNRLVGLALLNIFDLINYALVGVLFLALYGALKQANKSAMMIATVLGLVGITVCFASNQAFSMLSLSEQFAIATTIEA
jgi:hypothetical protein